MKNFEWQTEEESDERLFLSPDAIISGGGKWKRKLAALFGLLVLIVGVIYWQLDRRADAQTAVFEADVTAVFNVWRQAVAQSDEELFNSLLVGALPSWATTQRSLFHAGLVMNRSQLDLALATDEDRLQASAVEVELSPNWTAAEISFEQVYNVIDHPVDMLSSPQEIRLAYDLAFQRNADRWFLLEPGEDYWGDWQSEEKSLLTVTYPERDKEWALRLAQDLNADLAGVCRRLPANVCAEREAIELRLDTEDVTSLLARGWEPTLVDGRVFIAPTFSLIGRPVDEDGYALLYRFYTHSILDIFSSWVDTPIPLPDQELQLICYPPEARSPRLIRFTALDEWVVDLPDESFRYLSPMATDEGVILQHYLPGEDSSHLRLTLWQNGRETLVYDNTFNHLMLYPVGWATPPGSPNLMLHGFNDNPTFTAYTHIDLNDCDAGGCRPDSLEGFPVWSPDGNHTILQVLGTLFLGDATGKPQQELGRGVDPFWLDNERYGYVRYLTGLEASPPQMEIVTAEINANDPQRFLITNEFAEALGESGLMPGYISYVTVNPTNPYELYVALRSYEVQEEQTRVFSIQLSESGGNLVVDDIVFELSLKDSAVGYPSLVVENGFVPFVVSADGRWISASRPSPDEPNTWLIFARDTQQNETYQYAVGYPSAMFIHPYYDWSKDGNWLVIVDQNYLRLLAPAHNYERIISHNLQNCSHAAWVNPVK